MSETSAENDYDAIVADIEADFNRVRLGKAIAYLAIFAPMIETEDAEQQLKYDLEHAPYNAGTTAVYFSEGSKEDVAAEIEENGGWATEIIRIPNDGLDAVEAFEKFVYGSDVVRETDPQFVALLEAATQAVLIEKKGN